MTSHIPVSLFPCPLYPHLPLLSYSSLPFCVPALPSFSLALYPSPPLTLNPRMAPITRTCWCVRVPWEWPPVSLPPWEASPAFSSPLICLGTGLWSASRNNIRNWWSLNLTSDQCPALQVINKNKDALEHKRDNAFTNWFEMVYISCLLSRSGHLIHWAFSTQTHYWRLVHFQT